MLSCESCKGLLDPIDVVAEDGRIRHRWLPSAVHSHCAVISLISFCVSVNAHFTFLELFVHLRDALQL